MIRPTPRRRFGFTLVEMLVVIVIIGILVALLVPVIANAVRTARDAAVTSEITGLANALNAFKEKYGEYPPSRIILREDGFYDITLTSTTLSSVTWFGNSAYVNNPPINNMNSGASNANGAAVYSANDISYGQLAQRSIRFLRKFFPRANFSTTAPIFNAQAFHDFNGDNVFQGSSPILLEGHECLVFFLGGITNHTANSVNGAPVLSMDGFAKDPVNPFVNSTLTQSRYPSFFEWKSDRLIDDDGDGIPGYVDSLATVDQARYYAYFSAYGQNGYDPNDVNFSEPDDNATTPTIYRAFRVNFGVPNPLQTSPLIPGSISSPAPNPYTSSDTYQPAPSFSPAYQNPNTFQIISPGRDRFYGIGGQYLPTSTGDRLPFPDPPTGSGPSGEILPGGFRNRERENLTNFANSKLD
jgi:general secretion pathway protein G